MEPMTPSKVQRIIKTEVFCGPERLDTFKPLGRLMRMGAPAAAGISDRDAVETAIILGKWDDAQQVLETISAEHAELLQILGEWALQVYETLSAQVGDQEAASVHGEAEHRLQERLALLSETQEATHAITLFLSAVVAARESSGTDFRSAKKDGGPTALSEIFDSLETHQQATLGAIRSKDADEAKKLLTAYWSFARAVHDCFVTWIDTIGVATLDLQGQIKVEELIRKSFASCSFFEPLWSIGLLPPEDIATFLAAHIRAHFSGDNRGGGIEVIEDADKFRLIFSPCGSGGALRQRNAITNSAKHLPKASGATWIRASEVSPYCIHCAFNEVESIRRFGYPKLVTNYDPDPARPCGWTIYKRKAAVPDHVYERLGISRGEIAS